jgi:hypothetical protein
MDANEVINDVTKRFTDEGKLIEAGWQAYRMLSIPPNASDIQVRESRLAYFLGAQHLFASIMGIMDSGTEPTEDDLRRLTLISNELDAFIATIGPRQRGPFAVCLPWYACLGAAGLVSFSA